ncbi:aminoglycoside phosphotransferase [Actinomadura harenae]|uniref:Aminoglycoside phosphotransferase n=1 Tax=Actinomadura harenae TaxID=2483351 RepID=A0A3M2MDK8_9ACTN|nr:aminoglycoside phosphotransferase [Actinomadura harenae]RMI47619.1 aminoglycoside phosphotransferase [Actinomadura harenae]
MTDPAAPPAAAAHPSGASWMDTQFDRTLHRLSLWSAGPRVRGIGDRTMGGLVVDRTTRDRSWLRVLAVPTGQASGVLWDGPISAPDLPGLRRPALEFFDTVAAGTDVDGVRHTVRAEVWELIDEPVCAPHETLTPARARTLGLTPGWWATLDASLSRLAAHPTDRVPRTQEQITVALRRAYGPDVPTLVERWTTQHGDLRWTNLTCGTPYLLDWEFWGRAPLGTDAATLYCTSLLVPGLAAAIHERYQHLLDTPEGRIAQLCVCVQLRRHRDVGPLDRPLAEVAARLLG